MCHAIDVAADVCLPSFDVEIEQSPSLKKGQDVALVKEEDSYAIYLFAERLAVPQSPPFKDGRYLCELGNWL